jgi:hypothetical protein
MWAVFKDPLAITLAVLVAVVWLAFYRARLDDERRSCEKCREVDHAATIFR